MSRVVNGRELPEFAGLRQYRKTRTTGTHVGLYEGGPAGLDTDGGRQPWSTVCEEHGAVISHVSLEDARSWAPHPEVWCEWCAGYTKGRPCDCMTEDPGDGYGERVVTHSAGCELHPEF